jgi:SAM-dependent methyltransferase
MPTSLQQQFGPIDIYLFDHLLRGNILPGMTIFDAGCGTGRNLIYLLREGFEIFANDHNPEAIQQTRDLAALLAPALPPTNFRIEPLDSLTFPDNSFDVVHCNGVLHFARDEAHFNAMLQNLWRVLKPGGLLLCRLASTIGMPHHHLAGRHYLAPNGVKLYCVDESLLMHLTAAFHAELIDPIKTTVVQDQRCMTTWALRKQAG